MNVGQELESGDSWLLCYDTPFFTKDENVSSVFTSSRHWNAGLAETSTWLSSCKMTFGASGAIAGSYFSSSLLLPLLIVVAVNQNGQQIVTGMSEQKVSLRLDSFVAYNAAEFWV